MSEEVALPLLTKKLLCFFEILAPPMVRSEHLESFINSQAFLLFVFLKVLPHVFIWLG